MFDETKTISEKYMELSDKYRAAKLNYLKVKAEGNIEKTAIALQKLRSAYAEYMVFKSQVENREIGNARKLR